MIGGKPTPRFRDVAPLIAIVCCGLFFLTLWAAHAAADAPATPEANCHVTVGVPSTCRSSACRQIARPRDGRCIQQGYLEYTPPGYGDGQPRPLIIMLHGLAENGDGSARALPQVANHGIPELIADNAWPPVPSASEFVVLSPQHRAVGRQTCPSSQEVHAFIEYAKRAYDVDTTRMYLTGLSCGGNGVWNYIGDYLSSDGIAAAIPIASDARQAIRHLNCMIAGMPTWTFHGERDPGMNVANFRDPIASVLDCEPAPEARLTIVPGAGHNVWTRAYTARHDDIYAWLLQHRRTR